jgi:hypothetical protein
LLERAPRQSAPDEVKVPKKTTGPKHLFVEYRHWLERTKPFQNVTAELASLARHRENFRRIVSPEEGDVVFALCSFLEAYDIRTAYPMLLTLMDAELKDEEWEAISRTLESYLVRRAVCNLGTKNYNRIFLSLRFCNRPGASMLAASSPTCAVRAVRRTLALEGMSLDRGISWMAGSRLL